MRGGGGILGITATGSSGGAGGYGGGGGGGGAANGGAGGFGGGGGGSRNGSGGVGNFGGGGGGAIGSGGHGGFGAGGGGSIGTLSAGAGGIGGGSGTNPGGSPASAGGGGAGFGGAIFVNSSNAYPTTPSSGTGSLTITGPLSITSSSVNAGIGANNGAAVADAIFATSSATIPLTFSPAALTVVSIGDPLSGGIGDDSAFSLPSGGSYTPGTASGAILKMTGPGQLILYGTSTYSGGTQLSGGVLILVAATQPLGNPASALTFTSPGAGTLQAGADLLTLVNPITLTSSGTIDPQSFTFTLSGTITGSGNLTIGTNETGTVVLSNTSNTYNGQTLVNSGTLEAGALDAFSSSSAVVMSSGATLNLGGFDNEVYSIEGIGGTIDLGGNTLSIAGGSANPFAGIVTGTTGGGLTLLSGSATTTLSGDNAYLGATTLEGGTLAAGSTTAFSSSSPVIMSSGATLSLSGYDNEVYSIEGTGGNISLGGNTLSIAGGSANAFAGSITGTGGGLELLSGSATTTLSGSNSYTGATTLQGGTLKAGSSTALSSASAVVMSSGATLNLNGFDNEVYSIEGAGGTIALGGKTLSIAGGSANAFAGSITGTGGGLKLLSGSGTTTLSGTNSYTGATTLNGGTLAGGATNAFSPVSAVFMSSGSTLSLSGHDNEVKSINGTGTISLGSKTLSLSSSPNTFAGAITGTGGGLTLLATSTGTTTLSGSNSNTYSGPTTLLAGTLMAGATNALSPNSNVALATGTTLSSGGFNSTIGGLSGTGNVIAVPSSTLTINVNQNETFAGTFSNTGTIATQGPATFNMTGNSPGFSGTIQVNNRLFTLNGILGGNAFVNSGSTFGGTGALQGNLFVKNGGTVAPGNSSIGTLTLNGFTQDPGGTYAVDIDGSGNSDLIIVLANASLNGTVAATLINGVVNTDIIYHIMSIGGLRSGTFSNAILVNNPKYTPVITYVGSDVYMQFTTKQIFTFAETFNQQQVSNQLNALADDDPNQFQEAVINEFLLLSSNPETLDQALLGLDQMSGQQYTLSLMTTELNGRQFMRRLYDPLRSIVTTVQRRYSYCYPDPSCCGNCWYEEVDYHEPAILTPWIESGGGRSFIDGNSNTKGLRLYEWEMSGGVQATFTDVTFGLAGSYIYDAVNYNLGGKGKNRAGYGAVYALYRSCGWYILADAIYGNTQSKLERPITIGTLFYSARGKGNINQGLGYIEGGFDLNYHYLLLQPFFGVEGGYLKRNTIRENGAYPIALTVHNQSITNVFSRVGVHLTMDKRPGRRVSVSIDLAWSCRLNKNPHYNITENFQTFGDTFSVQGITCDRNSFDGACTVSTKVGDNWMLFAEASGGIWEKNTSYNFLGGIKCNW